MSRAPGSGILSRSVLSTSGMAVQGVARLISTVAIGRLAGEAALGDASALLSVSVALSLVLPAGLGVAASRYLPVPEIAGAAAGLLSRWCWIASAILGAVAAPVAWWITDDAWAAAACAVLVWSYTAYVFTRGVLMGEDRLLRAALADLGSSILAVIALIAVLLLGAHSAILLPIAAGYAIFALAARPRTPARPASAETRTEIRRFVRDATLGALATGGLLPATMVVVRACDTPLQAGLFAAALSLATPASLVSQAVNQVLVPHFARLHEDPAALASSHRRLFLITTALFAVVFGALIALAAPILSLVYGDRFAAGAPTMQALIAVVFLISATCAPSAYLVASGRQRAFAAIWLVAFVVGATTMALASPAWGAAGALLGFAVGGGGGSLAVIATGLLARAPGPTPHTRQRKETS